MKVTVLYFSLLRDLAAGAEETLEIPAESTLADLLLVIYEKHPGLSAWDDKLLLAVNAEFADRKAIIPAGAEVALMPPVQGG